MRSPSCLRDKQASKNEKDGPKAVLFENRER